MAYTWSDELCKACMIPGIQSGCFENPRITCSLNVVVEQLNIGGTFWDFVNWGLEFRINRILEFNVTGFVDVLTSLNDVLIQVAVNDIA